MSSIDKEQIYYILYFLGVFDDEIAYLENMPIDILLHIFAHLGSEDIVLLCNSSLKIRNIFVNNRSFFFPQLLSFVKELDDSTYVQSFGRCLKYKYFDIYRDQCYLYKFKNNIITSYCRLYQTKDNDIKNYENFRITRYLIKANRNIVQLVKINHIIYMLLDDGTILNKNLMTNEEFVSVSLKNCLHITNYNEKLIITLINGECYEWDGSLRKLGWIKDVIKVVSNVYLTIDNEVYCEGIKIADDIVQFSDYLPFMLNKQGELLYINNDRPTKLGDKQNLAKIISSPGGNHYVVIMLDKNGNVLINKSSGVLLTGVEDIYFDLRITYGLYYIKDGLLNHVEIDNRTYQIKGEPVSIEW